MLFHAWRWHPTIQFSHKAFLCLDSFLLRTSAKSSSASRSSLLGHLLDHLLGHSMNQMLHCSEYAESISLASVLVALVIHASFAWLYYFYILLKNPSYSSSTIFQMPFFRPPSLTIKLRSESCLRYRCTWRREMPMFSDICVALI